MKPTPKKKIKAKKIKALDCRTLLEHNLSNSLGVLRPELNTLCP
jgi:hypothetical protein